MNVFKLLLCDLKEGTFKNKRFLVVPILALFECMSAHIRVAFICDMYQGKTTATIYNLFTEIFHGCDPLSKVREMHMPIPYMWLSVFIFSMFTVFDYAHDDISNFGVQIISRTGKRSSWWLSKCIWSLLSGVYFYLIFMITITVFASMNDYFLSFADNTLLTDLIANSSVYYTYKNIEVVTGTELFFTFISPLVVICTLNIMEMTFSLLIKPLYSFFVTFGILLLSVFVDWQIIFPRSAMVLMNTNYFNNGYNMKLGLVVCIFVILLSVVVGEIWFSRYDILPLKNEV